MEKLRMPHEHDPGAPDSQPRVHRSGFAAVVGLPNAGKSTLVNRLLDTKISIVSSKPQTTRSNITCIVSTADSQIVFIDTPGLLKPRYRMQEVMASFITNAVSEADVILVLIDASRFDGSLHPRIVEFAQETLRRKRVVALNKIDLFRKEKLLEIIARTDETFPGADIVPISALGGEGIDILYGVVRDLMPEGPKYFPDDVISNESERFFAAELIREAVFLAMDEEIPYATGVVVERYEEKPGVTVIDATILVEKDSQKPILVGKNGRTIKDIGTKARIGIEEFIGSKVYLDLHVKVRKDWREKDVFLREVGLLR